MDIKYFPLIWRYAVFEETAVANKRKCSNNDNTLTFFKVIH